MSQQINLYNPAFIPPREWVTAKGLALATAGALAVVILGAVVSRMNESRTAAELAAAQAARTQAQAALEVARAQLAARQPSVTLKAQVDVARARYALRERVLAATQLNLAEPGGGFSRYLSGLARQSVPGLWLNQVGIDASGTNLSLAGQTLRQEAVPEYVRRLKAEPAFAGKTFAGLDMAAASATTSALASTPGTAPIAVSPAPTSGTGAGVASGPAPATSAVPTPLNFSLLATRSTPGEVRN
jgi:type II secretory pathway pseudopilin PulG